MHPCTHVFSRVCIRVRMCSRAYAFVYACVLARMYVCIRVRMCSRAYASVYACVLARMHSCTHVFSRVCMYACAYSTISKTRIVMASEVFPRRYTPTTRPPAKTPVLAPRPVDMTLASSCVLSSPRCRTRIRSVFASTSHKNKTKRARARGAATAD